MRKDTAKYGLSKIKFGLTASTMSKQSVKTKSFVWPQNTVFVKPTVSFFVRCGV